MTFVEWIENRGSYEARIGGKYRGLVTRRDPYFKWSAIFKTADGGLWIIRTNSFLSDDAKKAMEWALWVNWSYSQWQIYKKMFLPFSNIRDKFQMSETNYLLYSKKGNYDDN